MSKNVIDIDMRSTPALNWDSIEAELHLALEHLHLEAVYLSIVIVNDEEIHSTNLKWRQKDSPTDVLSFPQIGGIEEAVSGAVLGDIMVSTETAARQSEEHEHSLAYEMRILLVHGLCHLLGYTHDNTATASEMSRLENELLRVMNGSEMSETKGLVERVQGQADV